jgi:glycosyltransferase involved in cell wall biosynthesis
MALRALAEPHSRDLPVHLLIIGDGPQRQELVRMSSELSITDRVTFQGPVAHDELPHWYRAADVGVFPSIADEAFGITIAEAMSCGKPVIASYIGGIPEVVGNEGTCGLLVPPGDVPALADAMRELALDPSRRASMGGAGRQRIESQFSWNAAGQRLLKALDL